MPREGKGFVEGHEPNVGKGSFANMKQDVVMKEYPKRKMGRSVYIDDSMSDIDDVEEKSVSKRNKYVSYQK